jgi:hypothetical protein
VSKHKSNVHPDHYKTAGREPQGRDVVQSINRQAYATTKTKEKAQYFATAAKASPQVPEAGPQGSGASGPVLVARGQKSQMQEGGSIGKRAGAAASMKKAGRSNGSSGKPLPSHSHQFTIADQDAVETLMSKLRRTGGVQPSPEKLRKAFETALHEFESASAVERKAFFHGLLTGYSVGVKLGQRRTLASHA